MIIYFIDLDGTIEDSKLDMISCVHLVREKLSLAKLEDQSIEKYVNKGMDELYKNCFSDFIKKSTNNYQLVKDEYENCYFNNVCIQTKCYEAIPKTLEYLSQKGSVVVITNKPEKISKELLKKLNVYSYLTDIMGGDSCAESKPSPLPLQIIAKKLKFNPLYDKSYMIGDSEGDIKTAQAFGAQSIWCSWGYLKQRPVLKPDFIVHHPTELQQF